MEKQEESTEGKESLQEMVEDIEKAEEKEPTREIEEVSEKEEEEAERKKEHKIELEKERAEVERVKKESFLNGAATYEGIHLGERVYKHDIKVWGERKVKSAIEKGRILGITDVDKRLAPAGRFIKEAQQKLEDLGYKSGIPIGRIKPETDMVSLGRKTLRKKEGVSIPLGPYQVEMEGEVSIEEYLKAMDRIKESLKERWEKKAERLKNMEESAEEGLIPKRELEEARELEELRKRKERMRFEKHLEGFGKAALEEYDIDGAVSAFIEADIVEDPDIAKEIKEKREEKMKDIKEKIREAEEMQSQIDDLGQEILDSEQERWHAWPFRMPTVIHLNRKITSLRKERAALVEKLPRLKREIRKLQKEYKQEDKKVQEMLKDYLGGEESEQEEDEG